MGERYQPVVAIRGLSPDLWWRVRERASRRRMTIVEFVSEALERALVGAPMAMGEHGVNCPKVPHTGEGYLHGEDDDRPYDVDDVMYCGRCHMSMNVVAQAPILPAPPADTPGEDEQSGG